MCLFSKKYPKITQHLCVNQKIVNIFVSTGIDLTFEYPHAMVHACLLPKKMSKITQPPTILKQISIWKPAAQDVTFEYTHARIIKCLN